MDHDKCCPTGPAGNTTIVNQDEQEILNRCAALPARTEGSQESDAH